MANKKYVSLLEDTHTHTFTNFRLALMIFHPYSINPLAASSLKHKMAIAIFKCIARLYVYTFWSIKELLCFWLCLTWM